MEGVVVDSKMTLSAFQVMEGVVLGAKTLHHCLEWVRKGLCQRFEWQKGLWWVQKPFVVVLSDGRSCYASRQVASAEGQLSFHHLPFLL